MAVVNTEPKFSKRRKLGKNKKKSWRASNVDDVEDFLADERRQIRTGGIVAEKSDEVLFVLDKGKTEGAKESKSKKRLKDKPLKCLSLLQPNPNVKSVRSPDQDGFQKGKRSQRVLERLQARSESAIRVAAQEQRTKDVLKRDEEKRRKRKLPEVDSDIWADDDDAPASKVKKPKTLSKKPSALRATVVPHPGASVNPAFEDHQDLLHQAHKTEVVKEKKAKQIYNALDAMFPSKEQARINQVMHMKEMAAGLYDDSSDEDSEDEDDDSDEEDAQDSFSVGAPVRREDRKTRKQKKAALAERNQTQQKKSVNDVKKREHMVLRIPSLKTEINKAERETKQRIAKRQTKKSQEKFKTKRLNTIKFEEPDQDIKLSTELVASLREIKPEGHVMNDVYKSLQRRNIIEPRVRQKKNRKYRPKVFEKKSHKAVTL